MLDSAVPTLGALILVLDHHHHGETEGEAILNTRLDLNSVLLVAGGCDGALAGTAAGQLWLDIGLGDSQLSRNISNCASDRLSVGLAPAVRKSCVSGDVLWRMAVKTHTW